jgi:hypothetical protein
MAFRNAGLVNVPAITPTELYKAPTGYEAVIHSLFLSNVSTTQSDIQVTVSVLSSALSQTYRLIDNGIITAGITLIFDKPINLTSGDQILVTANIANSLEVFASILLATADSVAPLTSL